MERLRPVYETGVLRLLLRQNSMMYVALLRAAFDPLTGELPRETLEESFSQSLSRLVDSGEYQLREDQTIADASRRILADLTREGEGDYAWLANSMDVASHRYLYRLTARAHRAIEALDRLEDTTKALSGAQANSIIMEIEHARMQLTADPGERVALLNREIKARKHEIRQIRHGQRQAALTESQVEDVIAVIHNTLRGVPIDLRELVLTERDNGDALRRRMQAGDMSVDDILTSYHDEYRRSFSESDNGRRFEDAFQVIVTDGTARGCVPIPGDITIYAPWGNVAIFCKNGSRSNDLIKIGHIDGDGIEAVRRQMRVSDEAISRLVRQQTDTRYRTMLGKLNRLYAHVNADAKAHQSDDARPYRTDTAAGRFPPLPSRPARPMVRTTTPGLSVPQTPGDATAPDLRSMIDNGGPRLRRMAALILESPVYADDGNGAIDIVASFNGLPKAERKESELVGFLGELGCGDGAGVAWHCISADGSPRDWITGPVLAQEDELHDIVKED